MPRGLGQGREHVRDLKHDDPREAVGDDAADEQEHDHASGAHAEHLRERAARRVDVQHRETNEMGAMTEPTVETVRAAKYQAKRRSDSTPSDARTFTRLTAPTLEPEGGD